MRMIASLLLVAGAAVFGDEYLDDEVPTYEVLCKPRCFSFVGAEFAYPVNQPDRAPTGGLFAATEYAHRADVEDMGFLMQRVPAFVYRIPNATTGGGPFFADVSSAFTAPAALLFHYARREGAPAWLRIPAELAVMPNSLYAMHFGNHPLGYAFGLSTSVYAGAEGLRSSVASRFGVLIGLKRLRFTMGADQRLYASRDLEMPGFSYWLQADLIRR